MGTFITLRTYLDLPEAELARARLDASGIRARVVEGTSFNPLLNLAAGGIRLEVWSPDADRAEQILAEQGPAPEDLDAGEDEAGAGEVVRCPRCELEYCFYERVALPRSGAVPGVVAIFYLPLLLFGPRRWHCRKCEHVWDDPAEGPKVPTRLQPGDPRPVFRIQRAPYGRGVLLGLMVAVAFALSVRPRFPEVALALLFVAPLLGWLVAHALRADVCSGPGCREPLPPGVRDCPACKGAIVGRVRSPSEHHAAAADFRRELAACRAEEEQAQARPKKKKIR